MRALEPRVMLDAAAVDTAADHLADAVHSGFADDWFAERAEPGTVEAGYAPVEYVFIDAGVENAAALVAELPHHVEVVLLSPARDGVEQIAAALDGASEVSAAHIISHGRAGALALGTAELSAASMSGRHADALARIGAALADGGDLLIYGCDFAAGAAGADAVAHLARATGADVAASTDDTGSASAGGDWHLEAAAGLIQAAALDGGDALAGTLGVAAESIPTGTISDDRVDKRDGLSQTFVFEGPEDAHTLDKIELLLNRDGDDRPQPRTVIVRIYDDVTGALVVTGEMPVADLNEEDLSSVTIDLFPVGSGVAERGVTYRIEVMTRGANGHIHVGYTTRDDYGPGALTRANGTRPIGGDLVFKIDGDPVALPSQGPVFTSLPTTDTLAVPENQRDVVDLSAEDPDGDDAAIGYAIVGGADAARFTIEMRAQPGGGDTAHLVFRTAPDAEAPRDVGRTGTYEVQVAATDEDGETTLRTLDVTVENVDEAPVPTGLWRQTGEGGTVFLAIPEFAAFDPEGDPITSVVLDVPPDFPGTVTAVAGGYEVRMVPGFIGVATFQYRSDNALEGTRFFDATIETLAVDRPPIVLPGSVTTTGDEAYAFSRDDFAIIDEGDSSDGLWLTFAGLDLAGGTLSLAPDGPGPDIEIAAWDRVSVDALDRLRFVPGPDFVGTAGFDFLVSDSADPADTDRVSGIARMDVVVTPADAPPVASNVTVRMSVDETVALPLESFGGFDPDGDAIRTVIFTGLDTLQGGVLANADGPIIEGIPYDEAGLATLTFTPAPDMEGTIAFGYALANAAMSEPASVTIVVSAADDTPPVVAVDAPPAPPPSPPSPTPPASDSRDDASAVDDEEEEEEGSGGSGGTAPPNLPEEAKRTKPVAKPAPAPPAAAPKPEPEADLDAGAATRAPTIADSALDDEIDPSETVRFAGYTFSPMDPEVLTNEIARAGKDMREHDQFEGLTAAKVTFALGSALAVGSVTYLLQGGALAGALISAMPAWRRYDPIEIVSGNREGDDEAATTFIGEMQRAVDDARARVTPEPPQVEAAPDDPGGPAGPSQPKTTGGKSS